MQTTEHTEALSRVLLLPKAGRASIFGMTGAGKTILEDTLRGAWLSHYTRGKVLIVDSKPHYRAQWELTGRSAKHLYTKWEQNKHDYVPGSYVVPFTGDFRRNLKLAFKKTRIVIAQGGRDYWPLLSFYMRAFYESFGARSGPRLLDIDEGADFFEFEKLGAGIILQALRAGRQLGLGVMFGSQRPKFIPKSTLTESDRIYLMKLKSSDDLKTVQGDGGLPKEIVPPERFHEFRFYDFYDTSYPSGGLFKLGGID